MNDSMPVAIDLDNNVDKDVHKGRDPREQVFIANLATCKTIKQAAIDAGYSKSYAGSDIYNKIKTDSFQALVKQHYNGYAHLLLPKLINIESQVIEHVLKNITDVPKYRHTLADIKRSTGILQPEHETRAPVINIKEVRNMMLKVHKSTTE